MKKTYKYLLTIAFNGLLCLFVAFTADAQHRDGGGGGGSRSSGGGGGGGSRPSGGGGGSRPSGGGSNVSRPSSPSVSRPSGGAFRPGGNQRVSVAPPRVNSQGIRPAYGASQGFRGGYGGNPNTRNSVVGTRGYIGAGGRVAVGAGGRGYVTGGAASWRTHGYYHYNHGYYGTYYAPRLGFSIGFLPYGYYPFYWNDYQYFYSGGLYYQYADNEYTVVEPPVGAEVTTLPSNAQSIVINGEQYYESNGVYYEPITKDDGTTSYQIAGKDGQLNTNGGNNNNDVQQTPQVGDIVQSLPPDCRKITLNGQKYYVSADGYYYQETVDQNNNKAYKIVGTPEDGPGN